MYGNAEEKLGIVPKFDVSRLSTFLAQGFGSVHSKTRGFEERIIQR